MPQMTDRIDSFFLDYSAIVCGTVEKQGTAAQSVS